MNAVIPVNVASSLPIIRGDRSAQIARHFGLPTDLNAATSATHAPSPALPASLKPPATGTLCLLHGASGSGKSFLLKRLRRAARRDGRAVLDLTRIALPARPIVDLFGDEALEHTLRRLARVGLAEVWTWLRPPAQLSEGQRWRLRLALALVRVEASTKPTLLVCDEFAAVLDRVSAMIVAVVLRRAVTLHAKKLSALVATSHDDLVEPLAPDVDILCDFGRYEIRRTS